MEAQTRPEILCVDDEPQILEGLALQLRRRCQVVQAASGAAALEQMTTPGRFAVVLSDMRMPKMNGAAFLLEARKRDPDAVRMLLTGQTDLESAVSAVNDGQIFRFLTKPCPPPVLLPAIDAALEQHRLITSERVLLERTLHGCIRALTDALALANPVAFGRANVLKKRVGDLAERLALADRWPVEVAAMLCELGTLTVPQEVLDRARAGQVLTDAEQATMARVPIAAEQLIAHIPRIDAVREILVGSTRPPTPAALADSSRAAAERGAQILRAAKAMDALEAQGRPLVEALDILRGRAGQHDPAVLGAWVELLGANRNREVIREVGVTEVRPGMVFAEDVRLMAGTLLVPRGYEATPAFLERVRNFRPGSLREPLRVVAAVLAGTAEGN